MSTDFSRRRFLAGATVAALPALASSAATTAKPNGPASMVKALTFDVFGTVVDWRTSIIREGQLLGLAKKIDVDWAKLRMNGDLATGQQ